MGNGLSTNGNQVWLFLDRASVEPGRVVSGNVAINVQDNTAVFDHLYIQVKGIEKVDFRTDAGNSADTSFSNTYEYEYSESDRQAVGENEFFSVTIPLDLMSQTIGAKSGQFQYPFSFALPQGLPPSFKFEKGSVRAQISYKVIVVLQSQRSALNWTGRLTNSADLAVVCTPPQRSSVGAAPPRVRLENSAEGEIGDCCACCSCCMPCASRGYVQHLVGVENNVICSGGSLHSYAEVTNGSKVPVKCTLRLVRRLRLLGRRGFAGQGPVAGVLVEHECWSHQEGPIYPNRSSGHRCVGTLTLPEAAVDDFPPSVSADLVRCSYEVQSVVRPADGCCGSKVTAGVPVSVVVLDTSQPNFEPQVAPQSWAPTVLDQQELSLPSSFTNNATAPAGTSSGHSGSVLEPLLAPSPQGMSFPGEATK